MCVSLLFKDYARPFRASTFIFKNLHFPSLENMLRCNDDGLHMTKRLLRFTVIGRVQGVSFRASAAECARRLGVTGWIRNHPAGHAVEGVAQGDATSVDAFIDWCKQGPALSHVDEVRVEESPEEAALVGFSIRY